MLFSVTFSNWAMERLVSPQRTCKWWSCTIVSRAMNWLPTKGLVFVRYCVWPSASVTISIWFTQLGQGGNLVESGNCTYGGQYVVNPSGGLISKGHPLGATGWLKFNLILILYNYIIIHLVEILRSGTMFRVVLATPRHVWKEVI